MKRTMFKVMMMVTMSLGLVNCSKSSDSSNNNSTTCQAGSVSTASGCLPQTAYCTQTMGVNAGYNAANGQCVIGTATNYTNGAYGGTCTNTGGYNTGTVCTSFGMLPVNPNMCPANYGYASYGQYSCQYQQGCCVSAIGY